MPAPEVVHQLVKRFEENIDSYRSSRYNETQLRREFLDPLFEALGWDVFNKAGYAENYKDVIHEDSIDVEGATKAPDYAFRIGGQRKFFLEAKKPFVGSGGGGGGGYGVSLLPDAEIQYYYLLGLLNSSLLSMYLKSISTPFQHGYIALNRQYIEQLPIRTVNFSDAEDKARHEKMVSLVERMLELHKSSPRTPGDKERVKREIESTDRAIDRLVYELYGLSEDEIRIVEGKE